MGSGRGHGAQPVSCTNGRNNDHGQRHRQEDLPAETHQLVIAVARHECLHHGEHEEDGEFQHKPHNTWYPGQGRDVDGRQPTTQEQNGGKRTHQHDGDILAQHEHHVGGRTIGWYSSYSVDDFYIKESAADLVNRANLVKSTVVDLLEAGNEEELHQFTIESGRASETRITVIAGDGTVLADTKENPAGMDDHRLRPEIDEAFNGVPGISLRFSNTLGERMLYSAIPITFKPHEADENNSVLSTAVLRLSMPITAIDAALSALNIKLVIGTITAVIAFLVTLFVSRNISRPLEEMTKRAEHYSKGDFSQRTMMKKLTASREVATLATAMDRMADQLDDKINTIVNQRNQLENSLFQHG